MNSLYCMPSLDQCADHAQYAMVCGDVEVVDGWCRRARHAVDRRAVFDHRFEYSAMEVFIETIEQPPTPVFAKRREGAEQRIRPPVRYTGHDQMPRCGDRRDRLAVRDMARDQRTGNRAHSDLVSAIPDRDRFPRSGRKQIIEWRGVGTDILPAHIAGRAVSAAPAALD